MLESSGSCSSSSLVVRWREVEWGEVKQGGPVPSVPSLKKVSAVCQESWDHQEHLRSTTLCYTGVLWDHSLSPTTYMDCCVCVSITTFKAESFKYALQTLQGVSFATWGIPWPPERRSTCDRGVLPLLQHCVPLGRMVPFAQTSTVLWHSDVGFAEVRHQSAAGLWHPLTALLFVIFIICAVIMLENGCFFLNKRKVAAHISRIKACLAGNQCRVLKMGRAAEPSTVVPVPGEQCFGSPEERLLLWHWGRPSLPFAMASSGGKPNLLSSMDCLGKPSPAEPGPGWPWW